MCLPAKRLQKKRTVINRKKVFKVDVAELNIAHVLTAPTGLLAAGIASSAVHYATAAGVETVRLLEMRNMKHERCISRS